MHRQALALCETILGKERPSTLTSMGNLAGVLSDQGKYEQAEEMHRQALELRERVLGKEHPSTLTSVYCLAHLVSTRKRFEKASILYQRTFSGSRLTPRPGHPRYVQGDGPVLMSGGVTDPVPGDDGLKCLNLNITVPKESLPVPNADGSTRLLLPVVFWIHG
jgi:hypothetical protein